MITVNLIGYGNVASHLLTAFQKTDSVKVLQIYTRNIPENLPKNTVFVHAIEDLEPADVVLLTVTDDTIAEVSENLPFRNRLVVHTSGSMNLKTLHEKNRRGVWYPLQTFTKGREISLKKTPICVEAEDEKDLQLLQTLAGLISKEVHVISSEERKKLHLAAVWGNNFSNHLFHQAALFLEANDLSFELLKPLLFETVQKLETLSPEKAQTGPAIRGDHNTIEAQLHLLPEGIQRELYTLFTESIIQTFKNERLGKKL